MLVKTFLIFSFLLIVGCANIQKHPVSTQYLNETIKTSVDSKVAQYYLNNYLNGKRSNQVFDEKIQTLTQLYIHSIPDYQQLKKISEDFSNDFAAIFFAQQLMKQSINKRWFKQFHYFLSHPAEGQSLLTDNYQVLFMPGWNYVDNGALTGSDMKLPRRIVTEQGIVNQLLLPPSNGSVEQGAHVLTQAILDSKGSDKNIIIIGASAAGPAIHLSLGKQLKEQDQKHVVAWVNLGGILQGSPLVDYFQQWPQSILKQAVFWIKGWEEDAVMSMSTDLSRERFKTLTTPESLIIVNYLALGLTGNLTSLSNSKYRLIKSYGPNDGLTLLPDAIAPNSATIIVVNSDHYFGEDPNIEQKTVALLKTIIYFLNQNKD